MIPRVVVQIDGEVFDGWTSARLTRSLDELAWSFNLSLFDKWTRSRPAAKKYPFDKGQECIVVVDDVIALVGWINKAHVRYTKDTHSVEIAGRSLAGDLIDCSPYGRWKWRDSTLLKIAQDLCDPFGITVRADKVPADFASPFKVFSLEEGEKVFDALQRLANYRSVIMTSDALGNVVFTQAGAKHTSTILGFGDDRVLEAARTDDETERFSQYVVKAQTKGTDVWSGDAAAKGVAIVEDKSVTRWRPLTILPDGQGYRADLERRAKWERSVRAGRSEKILYTVLGWYDLADLWLPNTLVRVSDPVLNVEDDLLLTRVEFMLGNDSGDRAGLELMHPSAFDVLPPAKPEKKKSEDWF